MHTTLLKDGRVLMMAGSGNDANNFAAGTFKTSVWNPSNNTFKDIPTPYDMFCSGHVLLPNGEVLILGGTIGFSGYNSAAYEGAKTAYIFNPATNAFTKLNDPQEGHWYPTLTRLANGNVLGVGGSDEQANYATDVEMFNFQTMSWQTYGQVPQTNYYWGQYPSLFLLADGKLFYTGAHTFGDQVGSTGSAIYDWQSALIGAVPGLPDKDLRDHAGSVLLPPAQNQTFLIAGGGHIDAGSAPTNSAAVINMNAANPSWTQIANMPGTGKQYVNLTTLFDRTVLEANGATGTRTGNVFTASIFNPVDNSWAQNIPADPVGRNYHSTSILMPDGTVTVMGSNPADGSWEYRISTYYPPYLYKDTTRPTQSGVPSSSTWGSSFDFTTSVQSGLKITSASLTALGSNTHQMDVNSRLVDLPTTGSGNTWHASVPANSNLLPAGVYMLTVLDSNGVPSVASMITIQ